MTFAFGNNQPRGSRELRWRIFVVICMVFVTFGVSAALGGNVALPIELSGLLGGNTLGFVFPFNLYLRHFGLKNDKLLLTVTVVAVLLFCYVLYFICLIGILKPTNF